MTRSQVISAFAAVKLAYFPRWDRENKWKIEFADYELRRGQTGYCDSKAATIYLDETVCQMIDAGVISFLIHEICHDVAAAGHNITWATRMNKAAQLATTRSEFKVARLVRSEIYSYTALAVFQDATGLDDIGDADRLYESQTQQPADD